MALWEREGILGRWPEYENLTKVIFRGCNQTESNGISWTPEYLNLLFETSHCAIALKAYCQP